MTSDRITIGELVAAKTEKKTRARKLQWEDFPKFQELENELKKLDKMEAFELSESVRAVKQRAREKLFAKNRRTFFISKLLEKLK